ncbi:MAG: helix-turn-helix domain-containing protein [Rubrivivax sp.]
MLACLDQGVPGAQIMAVLGVGRTALWRTRAAYLDGGLQLALFDVPRPGRPRTCDTDAEAQVTALACSHLPKDASVGRWSSWNGQRGASRVWTD